MKIEFSNKEVCNLLEAATRGMMQIPDGHTVTVELNSVYSRVVAEVTIEQKGASDE